jgi:NADH dehydrogenase FAD-containing subunit
VPSFEVLRAQDLQQDAHEGGLKEALPLEAPANHGDSCGDQGAALGSARCSEKPSSSCARLPANFGDTGVADDLRPGAETPEEPGSAKGSLRGASGLSGDGTSSSDGGEGAWAAPVPLEFGRADARPRVVIIGAGFGGMKAARDLKDRFRVTVCDCKNYFQYGPGILRSFVEPSHFDNVVFDLRPILEGEMGCAFMWGEVTRIDADRREVSLYRLTEYVGDEARRWRSGNLTAYPAKKAKEQTVIKFDYCVIAAGCCYNKMEKSRGQSLWFPTVLNSHQRTSAWNHIDERTIKGRRAHIEEEHAKLKKLEEDKGNVLVVGAGFIGVEWALEIKSVFDNIGVTIVNRPDQILCRWPRKAVDYAKAALDRTPNLQTITGAQYDPEDPDTLRKIGAKTDPSAVYACTGVQASVTFLPTECLTVAGEMPQRHGVGWVRVNRKLQVEVRADDGTLSPWGEDEHGHARVFSIGDCTFVRGIAPLPKQCYPAEEQGFIVSRVIEMTEGQVSGNPELQTLCGPPRPLPNSHWPWGGGMVVLSLGPSDAVFVLASTAEDGSGVVGLWGQLAAIQKEIIEVSKMSEERHGIVGRAIWHYVHNTPVHLWGSGPLCGY